MKEMSFSAYAFAVQLSTGCTFPDFQLLPCPRLDLPLTRCGGADIISCTMCRKTNVWVGSQILSMSWGNGGLSVPLRRLTAGWVGQCGRPWDGPSKRAKCSSCRKRASRRVHLSAPVIPLKSTQEGCWSKTARQWREMSKPTMGMCSESGVSHPLHLPNVSSIRLLLRLNGRKRRPAVPGTLPSHFQTYRELWFGFHSAFTD